MSTNLSDILSAQEVANIYDKCLEFLIKKGVKVEHPPALKMLDKAGAWVDFKNQQVRFSKEIIEAALRSVPREILLASRNERFDMLISYPRKSIYMGTTCGNPGYLEPESNTYRETDMACVAEWAQLAEVLDDIHMLSFPSAKDVAFETADIHALKTTFENSTKHVLVLWHNRESLEYLFELAVAVAGSKESLRKRPIINIPCCSIPPFRFAPADMEALILSARYGVPIMAPSIPSAGGTSPITIAGTVLQSGIEILALLVMSQLIEPGTPFIGNPVTLSIDMASGKYSVASVESILGNAACAKFTKDAFKIPTGLWAYTTDSLAPNGQSMMDKVLLCLLEYMAGGDILFEAGQLAADLVLSPIQLIIDDTIAKLLKRLILGVKVDEDTLAWTEIWDTLPGSHYLGRTHTLRHCREALQLGLLDRQSKDLSRENWVSLGRKSLHDRALDKYRELRTGFCPLELPEDVRKEMDLILRQAEKHLVK